MNDVRFLLRQVARRPLLYLLVVVILALGIGANSAIFTLTDAVLVRDLPVHQPERLVRIFSEVERRGEISNHSYLDFLALRETAEGATGVAAYVGWLRLDVSTGGATPERVTGALGSGNFFDVLGIDALLGRLLAAEDDDGIGGRAVAVLSHHYWRTRFESSPDVVGDIIRINGQPVTVAGVLPPGFNGIDVGGHADVWLPLSMGPQVVHWLTRESMQSGGLLWLDVVARLKDGVTIDGFQAELDARAQAQAGPGPLKAGTQGAGWWNRVVSASTAAVEPYGSQELIRNARLLGGIVLLVLLLTAANVAGLLSVRTDERRRELALRATLGAPHRRLVQMLFLESLLLAACGAMAGVATAHFGLLWIAAQSPDGLVLPILPTTAVLDSRTLAATALAAIFSTLFVGIAPALRIARTNPASTLSGAGTASAGRERAAWRGGLVGAQIALSALILVVAGLLLRSFWNTIRIDPGFEPLGAVTAVLDASSRNLAPDEERLLYARVLQRVSALPGVTSAGLSRNLPLSGGSMNRTVEVDNPDAPEGLDARVEIYKITPGFLEALGASIASGRDLRPSDMHVAGEGVLLVNETMAESFWPGDVALGRHLLDVGERGSRVVGIVSNHKTSSVREAPQPTIYVPLTDFSGAPLNLLARSNRDAPSLLPEVRGAIRELDPELPVLGARTLVEHLGNSYSDARLVASLLGGFAALALLLAAAGLYGMLGHVLHMRQREFGIRLAVGANSANIALLVSRQVLLLVTGGLLIGLSAAAFTGHALEGLLFGVEAFDPVTVAGVVLVVLLVAALVSVLPVRRAAQVNPTEVLRDE